MKWNAILIAASFIMTLPMAHPLQDAAGSASPLTSTDAPWPMFRMNEMRNGDAPGTGPATNKLNWTNNTGSACLSSPSVAQGKVFIGCEDGGLYCFNATTGTRVWLFSTGQIIESSPAVDIDADRVYVGCSDGYLYCINITSGLQVWRSLLGGGTESSPLLFNGKVYIGSPVDTSVYCFFANNGTLAWKRASAGGSSSPALADDRMFTNGNNKIWCISPVDGSVYWNASIGTSGYTSPVSDGANVYTGSHDGHVYSFNSSAGTPRWNYNSGLPGCTSTPTLHNGSIYVSVNRLMGGGGALHKLNASTGTNQWSYNTNTDAYSSPSIANERIYFSYGTNLVCLNTSDKSAVWTYSEAAGGNSHGMAGSPAIAYGNCYIGGSLSKVYCFGPGLPNQPPAAVTLAPPDTIRETSMWLRWSQNGDADFSKYEVHKSVLPNFIPSAMTLFSSIPFRTTNSTNVTGLNFSTAYYFKIRVWDNGDPVMFNDSNEVSATTATPNGAPAAVILSPPTDITPYSMKLTWTVNNDPDFAKYELHLGMSPGFIVVPSTLVKTAVARDGTFAVVINLVPWTEYYFKVRVYDNGTPPLFNNSNEVGARSGNTPPAAVVLSPPVMGATSAQLTWSASTDDDFALYEVHYSRNASFTIGASTLWANFTSAPSVDCTVNGLVLAKNYWFNVRVYDQGGMYNDSNYVDGNTSNTVPRPVISSPSEGDQFDTRTLVSFDGAGSSDLDGDALSFFWTSSIDGFLSKSASFSSLLTIGDHKITLYVDDGNKHNVSAKVQITLKKAPDRPPALLILSPHDNDEVAGVVEFSGAASDIDGNGTLTAVEVKHENTGWKPVKGTGSWNYSWNVSKLPNGKQKVSFRAFDGELYSPEVVINLKINNINLPPTVAITGPSSAAPFSKLVIVTGTASDPDGTVMKVEFSIDNGGWQPALGTSSWTYNLDTTARTNGPHNIRVRAFDGELYSEPASLNLTVKNTKTPINTSGSLPLLPIGAILAVIAGATVAVLLMTRRKKGASEVPPPQVAQPQQPQNAPAQNAPSAPAPQQNYHQTPAQDGYSQPRAQQDGYYQQPDQPQNQQQPQSNYEQQGYQTPPPPPGTYP